MRVSTDELVHIHRSSRQATDKIEQAHSVSESFRGADVFLVGSLVWKNTQSISPASDIDLVVTVDEPARFIQDHDTFNDLHAKERLLGAALDAYYSKPRSGELSIDVIARKTLEDLCTTDIATCTADAAFFKYGPSPQIGSYPIYRFDGGFSTVEKTNRAFEDGNELELPFFHICGSRFHYGMLLAKLLAVTPLTPDSEAVSWIDRLDRSIRNRLSYEQTLSPGENLLMSNLFYRRDHVNPTIRERIDRNEAL